MEEFYAESAYPFEREAAAAAIGGLIEDVSLGRLWLVVEADGADEVAGYVAVTFGYSLEYSGRDAFVDDLYLRPAYRGHGVGTRVLQEIEPECRALGVRALHLEVGRSNEAARALYRRQGFRANDRLLLSKRLP